MRRRTSFLDVAKPRFDLPNECTRLFGERVRALREQRGLTQEELADRAGMDRTFVSQAERGLRNSTLMTLVRLAEALDVDLGELVSGLRPSA